MDIKQKMAEYKVEYNVLLEEIALSNFNLNLYRKEKENSLVLTTQLQVGTL